VDAAAHQKQTPNYRRRNNDDDPRQRAIDLLDRLLCTDITIREFFRHADDLSDNELELLSRMIHEQYWQVKAKQSMDDQHDY
jgi:hypothetical protein